MTAAKTTERRPTDWLELAMKKGFGLVFVVLAAAVLALLATLYIVATLY